MASMADGMDFDNGKSLEKERGWTINSRLNSRQICIFRPFSSMSAKIEDVYVILLTARAQPRATHFEGCATAAYECREPKQNYPASQSSINHSKHVVKVFMVTLHVVRHLGKTVFVNIQVLGQHA